MIVIVSANDTNRGITKENFCCCLHKVVNSGSQFFIIYEFIFKTSLKGKKRKNWVHIAPEEVFLEMSNKNK